ncbi:aldolase [Arhodomonas sp. AD133]|uniref:aldolase n=1 Tax=Arhodomonas sp. AD133 TaxID=3415009 RepID=UPI003EC00299
MTSGRDKQYFLERSDREMSHHLRQRDYHPCEALAVTCRLMGMEGHEAGLAGQITSRADASERYWTLRFGLGFDEAQPQDFVLVDDDLNTMQGEGMANPATRFHLWVYRARPDVGAIIHTHPPYISALSMLEEPLVVAHMDATPFFEDCAFLREWPGVPVADREGELIAGALEGRRSILLAHHGLLVAGQSIQEAAYLAVYMERAARMQLRAASAGPVRPVPAELAREAHDYLLKPAIVNATFDYFARQVCRHYPDFTI